MNSLPSERPKDWKCCFTLNGILVRPVTEIRCPLCETAFCQYKCWLTWSTNNICWVCEVEYGCLLSCFSHTGVIKSSNETVTLHKICIYLSWKWLVGSGTHWWFETTTYVKNPACGFIFWQSLSLFWVNWWSVRLRPNNKILLFVFFLSRYCIITYYKKTNKKNKVLEKRKLFHVFVCLFVFFALSKTHIFAFLSKAAFRFILFLLLLFSFKLWITK